MKVQRVILALGLIIALSAAGCILGYVAGGLVRENKVVRWHSLGSPPEDAIELAGVEPGSRGPAVFVRAASGQLHATNGQEPITWSRYKDSYPLHGRECAAVEPHFEIPPAPQGVVDCIEYDPGFESMAWEDHRFVLLDDGTIWTWQRAEGVVTIREIYAFYGLILGLVAAILLVLVRLTTRWSRPGPLRRIGFRIVSKSGPGGSSRGR